MAVYYGDLSNGVWADATGADHAGNEYTGPAGMQAAMRGTGNATALAAGDTLYIFGTGELCRLVWLYCDQDVSGWGLGDHVQNDNDGGGVEGDDWTGRVVELSYGANTWQILVWLDAALDEGDIDLADGINNTDAVGGALDPIFADISQKDTLGIECDTASGGDGNVIYVVGTSDGDTVDGTYAVLDGNDQALAHIANNCLSIDAQDHWYWELLEFENAGGADVAAAGTTDNARYHSFVRCKIHDATGDGVGRAVGGNKSWYCTAFSECQVYSNGTKGLAYLISGSSVGGCIIRDNVESGWNGAAFITVVDNVIHNNGSGAADYGISISEGSFVRGNVFDGNHDSGLYVSSGVVTVRNNRFTDNGDGAAGWGVETDGDATVLDRWNFYLNNNQGPTNGATLYPNDEGITTRLIAGVEGYENEGADDFNCTSAATGYETTIDIDGSNILRVTRGIPSIASGGVGGVGRGFLRGTA